MSERALSHDGRWFRGDFHAHTNHSDGYYAPAALIEVARREGLDFLVVTDHNNIEACRHIEPQPDILVLPGVEVTLALGHFNVFYAPHWCEWMEGIWEEQYSGRLTGRYGTTTALMQQIRGEGRLVSINHPLLEPWEWRDMATVLEYVDCLEIWNDPSWPTNVRANPQAVALWTATLNDGYRITAIGGSDYHRPEPHPGQDKPAERLGLPSTYVGADDLSPEGILDALRRRRAYVSMGPRLGFRASMNGETYEIGADLGERSGRLDLAATVSDAVGQITLRLMRNGDVVEESAGSAGDVTARWSDELDPVRPTWYRLDVYDQQGRILAVTNPIFAGPRRTPSRQTFGDFTSLLLD